MTLPVTENDVNPFLEEDEIAEVNPFLEETEKTALQSRQEFGREFGIGFLSEALASPKTIADFVKFGSEWLAQKGVEQQLKKGEAPDIERLNFTKGVLSVLGFPSAALDELQYPSAERFDEMIRDFAESRGYSVPESEEPTLAEQRGKTIGQFTGGATFGGPKKLLKRLMQGFLGGTGAEMAKEFDFGIGTQIGASFALPALMEVALQIKQGQFVPNDKQLRELKQFATEYAGLTESEVTPLLQPKVKQASLGKIAKSTEKTAQQFEQIENKLGNSYEKLKKEASTLPEAAQKDVDTLVSQFDSINERLKASDFPSAEKLEVIKKIDKAIENISKKGISATNVIESWQDINKAVDWKKVSGGKKVLASLKEPYQKILNEINPEVAKDFTKLNKLYENFKNIEKTINPNQFKSFMEYGKYAAFLGNMVKGVAFGESGAITKNLTAFVGYELAQNIATKLLTDPKYQNISIKAANAVKQSSRSVGVKVFKELADQISEDFPELAKEENLLEMSEDKILKSRGSK